MEGVHGETGRRPLIGWGKGKEIGWLVVGRFFFFRSFKRHDKPGLRPLALGSLAGRGLDVFCRIGMDRFHGRRSRVKKFVQDRKKDRSSTAGSVGRSLALAVQRDRPGGGAGGRERAVGGRSMGPGQDGHTPECPGVHTLENRAVRAMRDRERKTM